jgi:hypothetical protein
LLFEGGPDTPGVKPSFQIDQPIAEPTIGNSGDRGRLTAGGQGIPGSSGTTYNLDRGIPIDYAQIIQALRHEILLRFDARLCALMCKR